MILVSIHRFLGAKNTLKPLKIKVSHDVGCFHALMNLLGAIGTLVGGTGLKNTRPLRHKVRVRQNESAPIQLAQCRFPGLAISSANI